MAKNNDTKLTTLEPAAFIIMLLMVAIGTYHTCLYVLNSIYWISTLETRLHEVENRRISCHTENYTTAYYFEGHFTTKTEPVTVCK